MNIIVKLENNFTALYARGEQHHADGSTDGACRDVLLEASAHNTVVAVGACNLTPDNAHASTVDLLLAAIDVCNALAKVEVGILAVVDAVNADEGGTSVLVNLASVYLL